MRKSLLLLLSVLISLSVNAQEKSKKLVVSPTIELGTGFNMAIYNKSFKQSWNLERSILCHGELLFGVDFKMAHGDIMLQTGIGINNHDFSYKSTFGDYTLKSLYLDVPTIIGYGIRVGKGVSIFFSGGVVVKNLIKYDFGYQSSPPVEVKKKTVSGLYGAFGIGYRASPNFTFRIEPFFEYFWHGYKSTVAFEAVEYLSAPIIGIRLALMFNVLKME